MLWFGKQRAFVMRGQIGARWVLTAAALCGLARDAAVAAAPSEGDAPLRRPLVGAIRWDAWHGAAGGPGLAVEKSLGPQKYHFRLPFFAKIAGPDKVEIRGDNQAVMDREIAYAKAAGVDYWAFVYYEPGGSMSLGLKHYLASRQKSDVRFCLLTGVNNWGTREDHARKTARFVQMMQEPTYQTVLDGRPLIYLGFIDRERIQTAWGSRQEFRKAIDAFRAAAARAKLANPYIVCMDFTPARGKELAHDLGLDAISAYARPGGSAEGTPFAESMKLGEQFWETCRATGSPLVPLVSFGWDTRPRVDNPVPWVKDAKPNHYQTATPEQLAEHLKAALDWTVAHRAAAPANAVIVYAWNENDEGGWLVPTLNPDGTPDLRRIEAVGRMLRAWSPPAAAAEWRGPLRMPVSNAASQSTLRNREDFAQALFCPIRARPEDNTGRNPDDR
jgi:hypothetical protein